MSKIIRKSEINQEIKDYIKVRTNSDPKLQELAPTEKEYYTSPEIGYIFEVDELLYIIGKYSMNGCNAVKAYYGMNTRFKPTIVIVPCKITKSGDAITSVESLVKNDDDEGVEWPEGVLPPYPFTDVKPFDVTKDNLPYAE